MRVLMLSWEYPPVVIGGLGRHVHALAKHLAGQGHEVVVLCRHAAGTDALTHPTQRTLHQGVRLVRVAEDPTHLVFEKDLVAWTLAMGHAMIRAGLELLGGWRPDVVHAHDWLVTHPAITLAEHAQVPLIATVHATEAGRHSGWPAQPPYQQTHSVEWGLAHPAQRPANRRFSRAFDSVAHASDVALAACLAAADAVVLPSRYEPFGIVALEAAAAGAPLVSSTTGGLGEVVIHNETGLSFAPGDVEGL